MVGENLGGNTWTVSKANRIISAKHLMNFHVSCMYVVS